MLTAAMRVDPAMGPRVCFDIGGVRVTGGLGNDPMDTRLVQYLLYWYDQGNPNPVYGIDDVDGVFGPRTKACLSRMEKDTTAVLADGVVDRMPAGTTVFGSLSGRPYKLYMLHFYYFNNFPTPTNNDFNQTVLNMPSDGVCPAQLSVALANALTVATGISQ